MNILIVISNPAIGGTETFILSTAPCLLKKGCNVTILNLWKDSLMVEPAMAAKLDYRELRGRNRKIGLKEFIGIFKILKKGQYDIVLGFGLRISILLHFFKIFFPKTKFIIGLREIAIWRKWYHVLLDRLTQWAYTLWIANSKAVADAFINREKFPFNKIVVVENGIAIDKFNKNNFICADRNIWGLPNGKLIVTTVANLRYEKGYDFYIKVIEKYLKEFSDVHFVWIGEGSLKVEFENKIRSINAIDKITLLGRIEDVRPILSCSDIFVLPSREEGMPRALMEAMAMSLPCVATNVGGVNEVIENGVSGFIADFNDIDTFGADILTLVHNKELRHKIANMARKRIEDNFDILNISEKYVKLFKIISSGCCNRTEIQKILN